MESIVFKTRKNGVMLVPHFKTHQSAIVGDWYKGYGFDAITVSSVKMARCFVTMDGSGKLKSIL